MKPVETVYLVDDDIDVLDAVGETLKQAGLKVRKFHEADKVLANLTEDFHGIVLSDLRMPRYSGLDLLRDIRGTYPDVPVVMVSAHGDVSSAVDVMKHGADDFIEKPIDPDLLIEILRRSLEVRRLHLHNKVLLSEVETKGRLARRLPGRSRVMRDCRDQIRRIAKAGLNVIIHGEPGTGKGTAARAIHALSDEPNTPFEEVNGLFLNDGALGRALFGDAGQHSAVEKARGGVLFIDRLEKLSLENQNRLERVLATEHMRVIASTGLRPEEMNDQEAMLPDLVLRVGVASLELPPLRSRREDIEPLMLDQLDELAKQQKHALPPLSKEILSNLKAYPWPGNMRELRNVAERLAAGLELNLARPSAGAIQGDLNHQRAMEEFERGLLERALIEANGKKQDAARLLAIPRKKLYLRMKQLGL